MTSITATVQPLRINGTTTRVPVTGHNYDDSFRTDLEERYSNNRPNIFIRFFRGVANFCRDFITGRFFSRLFNSRATSPNPLSGASESDNSSSTCPERSILASYINELRSIRTIPERTAYLEQTVLPALNQNLRGALRTFNTQNSLNFRCLGIDPGSCASHRQSGGLVFVHAEPGQPPIRITLNPNEIQNKSENELVRLLTGKVNAEKSRLSNQYSIWSRGHQLDLAQNSTSVMAVAIPNSAVGIETDHSTILSNVYQGRYGARIRNVCMQNQTLWNSIRGGLPQASGTSREQILSALGESLDQAIAAGDRDFVFHATWHGETNGDIRTSSGVLTPEAIADTLIANNRCKNTNITIILESCYSQKQMERILSRIRQQAPERVANIRIVTTANSQQRSDAASHPSNSSLINNQMNDSSGTFAYYFSYYYQMNPTGSLIDAIRFADLMAGADSIDRQDLQAVEYFTNPRGILQLEQLSRRGTISENPLNPTSLVTV